MGAVDAVFGRRSVDSPSSTLASLAIPSVNVKPKTEAIGVSWPESGTCCGDACCEDSPCADTCCGDACCSGRLAVGSCNASLSGEATSGDLNAVVGRCRIVTSLSVDDEWADRGMTGDSKFECEDDGVVESTAESAWGVGTEKVMMEGG